MSDYNLAPEIYITLLYLVYLRCKVTISTLNNLQFVYDVRNIPMTLRNRKYLYLWRQETYLWRHGPRNIYTCDVKEDGKAGCLHLAEIL
jgi:hypothetical protein